MAACWTAGACVLLIAVLVSQQAQACGSSVSCKADFSIPLTWQSSVDGSTNAAVNVTLENTGNAAVPAGEHNFTYSNPNLLGMMDTYGFNVTDTDNGTASGVFTLDAPLPPNSSVSMGGVLSGSSPENFHPTQITLDEEPCKLQQV